MSLGEAQKWIAQFFVDIQKVEDAYQYESFSYFAIKVGNDFFVIQGTLTLNVTKSAVVFGQFNSENIKVGHFEIAELGLTSREFIAKISTGEIPTLDGILHFPGNGTSQNYGAIYHPLHEAGLPQRRLSILSILGSSNREWFAEKQLGLDWEVRAASQPYDGTKELLATFKPGTPRDISRIDVVALEVAAIEGSSVVEGEQAKLLVRLATKGSENKLSVGVRISSQGAATVRTQVAGSEFSWTEKDGIKIGKNDFSVPRAAVVLAIANYNGVAQHYYFFGDPNSYQNPRRAAYEASDPKFEIMSDIIAKAQGRGQEARDFEALIPCLFWMLGFAPAYLGGPKRMSDAPDFLASTPAGHIAVVECTTGLLKDDSKLQRLYDRAQSVRQNLNVSDIRHVRVLPVIVTSKSGEAIRPDKEQARRLGVYVIAREEIEEILLQTLFLQNADQIFEQAEKSVQDE